MHFSHRLQGNGCSVHAQLGGPVAKISTAEKKNITNLTSYIIYGCRPPGKPTLLALSPAGFYSADLICDICYRDLRIIGRTGGVELEKTTQHETKE